MSLPFPHLELLPTLAQFVALKNLKLQSFIEKVQYTTTSQQFSLTSIVAYISLFLPPFLSLLLDHDVFVATSWFLTSQSNPTYSAGFFVTEIGVRIVAI